MPDDERGKSPEAYERKPMEGEPGKFKIVVRLGDNEPVEYFPMKAEINIGRATEGNDITLSSDSVSKHASKLVFKDGSVFAVDLKSTCRTYVDECKITAPTRLGEQSKIYIGDFTLEVKRV